MLAVAQSRGSIQLVLRGYGDPDSVVTRGATSADVERALRDGPGRTPPPPRRTASRPTQTPRVVPETVLVRVPEAAPKQPAKPDTNRVEIFRGAQKSELKFQKDSVKRDTIVKN
jgi:hypothetical protein